MKWILLNLGQIQEAITTNQRGGADEAAAKTDMSIFMSPNLSLFIF